MNKQKLFWMLLALSASLQILAQGKTEELLKVTPPSPNVASLGKYGEVPVSLYTGVPNISIPLYEIKDGSLDLPISISYHAGGIKVEEIASSVGLSWSLNAGGVIGRNVRGLPDELNPWHPQMPENTIEKIMLDGKADKIRQLVTDIDRGDRDGEADLYYYNFNQFSGKFFYDQSGVVHTLPAKNHLIHPIAGGWKITTEDGTVYTFSKAEAISSASCSGDQSSEGAWFLTSIISADGKREINFSYDKVNYTYQTLIGQTKYFSYSGVGSLCLKNPSPCLGTQNYNTHKLARIDFSDGYVNFNYKNQRCDLMEDKSLDEIKVYNKNNQLVKGFRFGYSYFGDNRDGCNFNTQNLKRLKLVSVAEESASSQKPPYIFEYNETITLPGRLSYAQDHWGYYNGMVNNADLIAGFTATTITGSQISFPGADRRANPATAQAGILQKIIYPTGGETKFTFESNSVSDKQVEQQTQDVAVLNFVSNQLVSDLPNPFESGELVIPAQGAQVTINSSGLGNNLWDGCDIVTCLIIKDNNPVPFGQLSDASNGAAGFWPAGKYKLKLITECTLFSKANFSVAIIAESLVPASLVSDIRPVGGLRIKQIEDNPGDGGQPVIKRYRYHRENDPKLSSGVLINFPDYGYDLNVESYETNEQDQPTGPAVYCPYRVRQSFSNYPVATTQGSYVGYEHVIVDLGENGESSYTYLVYPDSKNDFPFAPVENYDWSRGFLLHSKDFARKNGGLTLAREIINTSYSFNQVRVYGIKTGRDFYFKKNGAMLPHLQPVPKYTFYPTITEAFLPGQTKERLYDQNDPSKFIETVTDYSYSPQHLQMVQSKIITSNGDQSIAEEIVTHKKYAFDYNFNGAPSGAEAAGIKNLQDLHAVNAVIEEYIVKQNRNTTTNQVFDQRVIDGGITLYKRDKPYPDQLLRLESGSPIPLADFSNGSALNGNTFIKNSNSGIDNIYKPAVLFNSYDDNGNVTTQQKADDVKNTYVWGYNSRYPVAAIVGEDHATIISNSNLNQSVIQSSSTTDEDMRKELHKIRVSFPAALVTTYTYNLLLGLTSLTDPNGKTIYYEYDDFGRLELIRDQDKNILKKYSYNFSGRQEASVGNVNAQWQATGNYRCATDAGNKNTGYQQREEKDVNPASSSYNQIRWVDNGINAVSCPLSVACDNNNCYSKGEGYDCINNQCEHGYRVNTGSNYDNSLYGYICIYHYEFSDGSWSPNYSEFNYGPCPF